MSTAVMKAKVYGADFPEGIMVCKGKEKREYIVSIRD